MTKIFQKNIATSTPLPQPPDCWIDLINLYIRLFNSKEDMHERDRFEFRDKAVSYLQIVHTSDENHELLRDPVVMEFIDSIGYFWIDGKLVKKSG